MTLIILLNIAAILDCLDTAPIAAPDEWSALDDLCFAATGDDPADDPRMWTGVR